jgi:large subunit ribosomal protein L7/L12
MTPEETVEEKVEEAPKEEKAEKPKAVKEKKAAKGITREEIIAAIKEMTALDLVELVKALEEEFGISAAPVAVGAVPASAAAQPAEAPAAEEKVEFTVVLKSIGDKKIEVIKAVRELTELGLKQAKDLVEAAPQTVKENVSREEANTIKQKLEAAGATVELK